MSVSNPADIRPWFLQENPKKRILVLGVPLLLWEKIALLIGLLVIVILPVFYDGYDIYEFGKILMYALAVLGLNILTGFNGQFSLGHSAFFAVGAYTTAVLMDQFGMPYWTTIVPAAALCFVVGFLFGLPALRLDGLFLALATFALAIATPQILKYDGLAPLTGGVQGISLNTPYPPAWVDSIAMSVSGQEMSLDRWKYIFTAIVVVIFFWLAYNLINSRTGRALIAIRDNPLSAKTMGINLAMFKSACFGVSAMFTGVAGSLFAIMDEYLAPESFTFAEAIKFLVGGVVGGIASLFGAIFGGWFVLEVPNLGDSLAANLGLFVFVVAIGLIGLIIGRQIGTFAQAMIGFVGGIVIGILLNVFMVYGFDFHVSEMIDVNNPQGLSWTVYGLLLIFAVYVMPMGATGLVQILVRKIGKTR
ncbi:branched-chain amino acid ABC transporter permease [Minwuia sp.]|uniref:branched-chain amino acid ABC transporter permease n=1 Tax=Minwuia sp. TaxID=2493630 RepID=UPI003A9319E7